MHRDGGTNVHPSSRRSLTRSAALMTCVVKKAMSSYSSSRSCGLKMRRIWLSIMAMDMSVAAPDPHRIYILTKDAGVAFGADGNPGAVACAPAIMVSRRLTFEPGLVVASADLVQV